MRHRNMHIFSSVVFGSLMVVFSPITSAASVGCDRLHTGGRVPTVQELTDCLDASSNTTRGLRVLPEGTSSAVEQQSPLVSLNIIFEFGSASLTEDAKKQLHTLGDALNSSTLIDDIFLIEGHTDSVGSAEYNQILSERRALAVKQYLVNYVGVSADRLKAEGRGETELLDVQRPRSATNRRVQIVNLEDNQ